MESLQSNRGARTARNELQSPTKPSSTHTHTCTHTTLHYTNTFTTRYTHSLLVIESICHHGINLDSVLLDPTVGTNQSHDNNKNSISSCSNNNNNFRLVESSNNNSTPNTNPMLCSKERNETYEKEIGKILWYSKVFVFLYSKYTVSHAGLYYSQMDLIEKGHGTTQGSIQ